ncbi:hypothetical protein [Lacrimispora amygdalina]|uniref:hypothetical protein n=1 Tax=Lacrimispora amygdalina TaxID=253257 RepID=UPI000BE251C0|nr:hypothetical protein [Lacrimispora amygdalina]
MRILFCNIAWMKFYKGTCPDDIPVNGGSYVMQTGMANEEFNFLPFENENGDYYCYGSVETKSTKGRKSNELHIEKLEGCSLLAGEDAIDDVLVIFCARPDRGSEKNNTHIVGWYQHATVFRNYQPVKLGFEDEELERAFNIMTKKENAVLLPVGLRCRRTLWWAPRANEQGYGFGQANVWFPTNLKSDAAQNYISKIVKQIKDYDEENWIDKYE